MFSFAQVSLTEKTIYKPTMSDVATSCGLADQLFLVCDTVAQPKSINQALMVQYPGLAGKIRMMKLNEILSLQCLDTQHYRTQKCKENPKSVSFMMHTVH